MAAKEEQPQKGASSVGGIKGAGLTALKFVIAALILPVVIASTAALQGEVASFGDPVKHSLWLGLVSYLVLYFFVYDFGHVYRFGQNVMTVCFQFLKPLVNVAPYVTPVYTLLVLIAYGILRAAGKTDGWEATFYTLMAFTFSMHIILTAKDLYAKDSAVGKPTYFFGMGLVYIFDVFVIALVMHATVPGFSFLDFFQKLAGMTGHIYQAIFTQLF